MVVRLYKFLDRATLDAHLFHLNYDLGEHPELACVDDRGAVFIAAGTDQGDEMGIALYMTGPEGYMHHYGVDYVDTGEIKMDWQPSFPVMALGAEVLTSRSLIA